MELNYRELKKAIKNNHCVILDDIEYMDGVYVKITKGFDMVVIHFKKGLFGKSRGCSMYPQEILKLKKAEFLDVLFRKYMYITLKFEDDF